MNFDEFVSNARYRLSHKSDLQREFGILTSQLAEKSSLYQDTVDAQRLLSAVSDENTVRLTDYIVETINQTLAKIFQGKSSTVSLEKTLHGGRYAHINVNMVSPNGYSRDMRLQTGQGVNEVVSFLFTVCLIAIRGGRRVLIMDELLRGVHEEALHVIQELMLVFADEGFQFIMVDYSMVNTVDGHSFGKIYSVEMTDNISEVVPVSDGEYKAVRYQNV